MASHPTEIYKTRISEIYLGDDGIIRITYSPNAEITVEDSLENREINQQLYDGAPSLFLIDIRNVKSTTKEAREMGAAEDAVRRIGAMALLVGSYLTQMIGNLFMRLTRPPYPTQMFKTEEEAIAWLKTFQE